jgi:elongation factor Ts
MKFIKTEKNMAITAADVKKLRDMTGVGMKDCQTALKETDGDVDKAILILREKGLASQAKKAGRVSAEGTVKTLVKDGVAAIVEINSETDFVAKNEDFKKFAEDVALTVIEQNPADLESLKACVIAGGTATVAETLQELFLRIRENLQLRRFQRLEGNIVNYTHGDGKIGVLVKFSAVGVDSETLTTVGKNVAMQIASMNPIYLTKEQVTAETIATETEIARQRIQTEIETNKVEITRLEGEIANSEKTLAENPDDKKIQQEEKDFINNSKKIIGKLSGLVNKTPEDIEKFLVPGKIKNFLKETCLLEQDYVKKDDFKGSVSGYLASISKNLAIDSFVRYELGEGIEKRKDDFAAEVEAMAKGQ